MRTEIGTSELTAEKLKNMTEEQLQKGKFHVEEEIHNIQPDVAKLSLLEKIPENLKFPEIKEEIEKQKPKALDMDKLQAVHDSLRSELERRGVKEASAQTDYNKDTDTDFNRTSKKSTCKKSAAKR